MLVVNGSRKRSFAWWDRALLFLLAVYGVFASVALLWAPRFFMPAEDAVILWGYSRNLALHGAITYFAGGPHTEGATDFAWMLLVAGAMKFGVDPFIFTALVNFACLVALALLLLHLSGVRRTGFRILVVMGAACLFPQVFAAASGFATLPDAVLLTLLVASVWVGRAGAAALVALLFCLFRPDGIVFAVPLLITMVAAHRMRARDIAKILVLFAGLGAAYFVWRAWYFGELFPLPFLVKADTHRVLHVVNARSVRTSLSFLLFSLLVLLPVWGRKADGLLPGLVRRRDFGFVASLVVAPTLFYWFMRLDQNVGFRFFFYLPLAAGILIAVNWSRLGARRVTVLRVGFGAWLVLMAMPMRRELRTFVDLQSTNLRAIAIELGGLSHHGTMVSTEAGILPYYSGWVAVDPWGLNTAEFAHRFFQPEDVADIGPDVIHVHADRDESCLVDAATTKTVDGRSWQQMIRNIVAGTDRAKYDLWLTSYGSERYWLRRRWRYGEGDRECWFVRRDMPEHDAIAAILSRHGGVGGLNAQALETLHVMERTGTN